MNSHVVKKISIFSLVFFLLSCNFQNNPQDKEILPSTLYTPTSILENPTLITTPSSISQNQFKKINDSWISKQECVQIIENPLQALSNHAGNLIVNGNNAAYILNIPSKRINELPQLEGVSSSYNSDDFKSSPDSTMVAFIESYVGQDGKSIVKRKLRIINKNLNFERLETWSAEWQWSISWLNNQELSMLIPDKLKRLFILNVFNGEIKEIDTSYIPENIDYVSSSWYIFGSPIVYFNSDVTKSIFPVGSNKISLWDVERQAELWEGENIDYVENGNAVWSFDGNIAIIVVAKHTHEEIVVIDFVDMTTEVIPLRHYANIEDFSLSPNGKVIGVWVSDDIYGFSQQKLILIDLSNKTIIDICIESTVFDFHPIWLDNKNFSIAANNYGENKVLLINIDDLIANTLIIDNVEPVAWLKTD